MTCLNLHDDHELRVLYVLVASRFSSLGLSHLASRAVVVTHGPWRSGTVLLRSALSILDRGLESHTVESQTRVN